MEKNLFIKTKGQILIEGIGFLIIFLGFLISVTHLEKAMKERIQKERLTLKNKKKSGIKKRKSSAFEKLY